MCGFRKRASEARGALVSRANHCSPAAWPSARRTHRAACERSAPVACEREPAARAHCSRRFVLLPVCPSSRLRQRPVPSGRSPARLPPSRCRHGACWKPIPSRSTEKLCASPATAKVSAGARAAAPGCDSCSRLLARDSSRRACGSNSVCAQSCRAALSLHERCLVFPRVATGAQRLHGRFGQYVATHAHGHVCTRNAGILALSSQRWRQPRLSRADQTNACISGLA